MADLSPLVLSPADALAAIRSDIGRLRARADQLWQHFLRDDAAPRHGQTHRVLVIESLQRRFDRSLWPQATRENPDYWRICPIKTVKVEKLRQPSIGGPLRDEDPALIEPFD